jgi:hypothetical protein
MTNAMNDPGDQLAGLSNDDELYVSEVERKLLAANQERVRRLYPGSLYDDLILLQRRGFVCFWHKRQKTLSVDGKLVSVAEFTALAERERRLVAALPQAA